VCVRSRVCVYSRGGSCKNLVSSFLCDLIPYGALCSIKFNLHSFSVAYANYPSKQVVRIKDVSSWT
jgi:hypothetical protein